MVQLSGELQKLALSFAARGEGGKYKTAQPVLCVRSGRKLSSRHHNEHAEPTAGACGATMRRIIILSSQSDR